jgi:cysteine-rich repeat protein
MARRSLPALILALILPTPGWCQLARTGPEERVSGNPPVAAYEHVSSVSADAAGNFVVTWQLDPYPERIGRVLARRYDASGAALGGALDVSHPASDNSGSDVAMDAAGSFVVVWQSAGDDESSVVRARRYDAAGAALGAEFIVSGAGTESGQPSVAQQAGGAFVVVWIDTQGGLLGQRYDALGVAQGGQFQVSPAAQSPFTPAVDADSAGNFTVVWGGPTPVFPIRARLYDAAGTALGSEISVAASGFVPRVTRFASGDSVVTWTGGEVMARRYDSAGVPLGVEFVVNTYQTGTQLESVVTEDRGGGFAIAWSGEGTGDSPLGTFPRSGIFLKRYDATATPVGGEVLVNTYTTGNQHQPGVAAVPGGFLVTWSTDGSQFTSYRYCDEVMAQRLTSACGNGMLDLAEQCDDGANSDGDGCDHACVVEHCRACTGAPSSCAPVTTCVNGDGCCASGCSSGTDDDCPILISGSRLFAVTDDTPYFDPFVNLLFVARDPAIDTSPSSGIDPAADGAYLHVYDSTESGCFELHAVSSATWRTSGADPLAPLFVYSDRKRVNGSCRVARVRDGREIRVKCNSLRHSEVYPAGYIYAPVGVAAVRFRSGGTEYCSVFGGDVRFDGASGRWHGFSARDAPVPASCPEPPRPCP